jgi:Tol biopolymer transport system component
MATVYLAHDLKHDRPVALKVLHSELAANLGPERFLREIRVAARLQHPHVLTVFDSGESHGQLWFTMPFVEGESLRDRLNRDGALPARDAVRIAREAGQGLHYAHEHGVVHRDVKPENILLTRDGNTLVADFGLARALETSASQLTATGMVVGTPSYMSPEQATGDETLDGRSDIYSLGCVLYEMVAGRPPFTGHTLQAVIAKHLTQSPPPIESATIAPAVSEAMARALAKSPGERFASAAEFVSALSASGAESRSPGAAVRPSGVKLATWGLAGGVVVAGAVVVGQLTERHAAGAGSVVPGRERKLSQLTVAGGVEEWPAWSPDGTRLVYAGEADGFKQLFIRTLATGEEHRVTNSQRDDIQPTWSPDGKQLAFVRARTLRGQLEPSDINGWYFEGGDIWTHDLGSGAETKLIDNAFGPSWSPDGARLAFDASWAGPQRIWVADGRGRNPRQVSADSNEAVMHAGARWAPDGSHLVFRRIERTKWDIVAADPVSSSAVRLTNDIVPDLDPVWSPDGRHIYFASARGGGLNLWRLPVTSSGTAAGAAEQLTTGAGDDLQPALSPDGRRIAFVVRGINSGIWRLPISPETGRTMGSPAPLVTSTRVESRGAWSPDGSTIAFNSDRRGDMNIWIRSLAGGTERPLTNGPGGDYQPDWSPDGGSIAFFSSRAGNADIWAVRLGDGALTQLTDDPATDINPSHSPDGRSIAFLSDRDGRSELWVMNADGSGERKLYEGAAGGHFLRWTLDGESVVFLESGARTHALAAPLAGGAARPLPDIASGAHMSFSPDGSLVLDVRGHKSLWVHPMDGRPAYQIFEFADPDVRIDYPVWSPDGRWVLFDRAVPRSGDVWMLEDAR